MTVRIAASTEDSRTMVSVAGRLTISEIRELVETCRSIGREFVLDLTDLRAADTEGIEVIRDLVSGGAKLRGASPFIRLLLDKPSPADVSD